jgi:hypothetical protein
MDQDENAAIQRRLGLLVAKHNNALQCIVLTAELALLDLPKDSSVYTSLEQIKVAAMDAATLKDKDEA